MRTQIVDMQTRTPILTKNLVSRMMFWEILDQIEQTIDKMQLKHTRRSNTINILREMKFVSCFNHEFRQNTYPELEEFLHELIHD